ncbi:hypothetical protein SRHO_G00079860 [Serrasalmus rhombeus]
MVAIPEHELQTLNRELQQLDQQIRPLLKWQTELHEWKTHLEAAWDSLYTAVSRLSPLATSSLPALLPPGFAHLHTRTGAGLGTSAWLGKEKGTCFLDISKQFPTALSKHRDIGTVAIHAEVNNVSSHQSEVLKEHFRLPLDTKKRTKARIIISEPTGEELSAGARSRAGAGSQELANPLRTGPWFHWFESRAIVYLDVDVPEPRNRSR